MEQRFGGRPDAPLAHGGGHPRYLVPAPAQEASGSSAGFGFGVGPPPQNSHSHGGYRWLPHSYEYAQRALGPHPPQHPPQHAPEPAPLPPLPPYQPPNPTTSHKPSVDDYFALPPSFVLQSRKRRRSETERPDDGRRMYQMFT